MKDKSGGMRGVIINYRRGRKTQRTNCLIIEVEGIRSRAEASKLIGRKIEIKGKNKVFRGVIVALHGNKGCVRARFGEGIPGELLGSEVKIL